MHVFIAVPAYTGQIHIETMRSIIAGMLALMNRGDKVTLWDESGNAMISHCRDLILAKFLASDATDIVFIDSDVVFSGESFLQLVDHPVDFVAGIYPQRRDPINYCVLWDTEKPELQAVDGLLEVVGVPAGFMRLSRRCVERMTAHYIDKQFDDGNAPNGYATALFDNIHEGRMYFGEDFSFCKRWRDIGGKVWIDPEIRMGHIGNKTFDGHLGNYLKGRT